MIRILSNYAVLFVFLLNHAAHLYAQPDTGPAEPGLVYLVVFEPGPAWVEGRPVGEQDLREHGRYLMERYAEGDLLQAGPFTDNTGGAILYKAETPGEVEEWVASDPAVKSGVMVATVSPWKWVEWEYRQDRAALSKLNAQFIENFINEDVEAHEKIIHPDFVCLNGDGTISNREDYMKSWATAYTESEYVSFSITDEDIRIFDNLALVRSKTVYTKEVNGEIIEGNSLYTDTYIKENGKWLCVQAHITPVRL